MVNLQSDGETEAGAGVDIVTEVAMQAANRAGFLFWNSLLARIAEFSAEDLQIRGIPQQSRNRYLKAVDQIKVNFLRLGRLLAGESSSNMEEHFYTNAVALGYFTIIRADADLSSVIIGEVMKQLIPADEQGRQDFSALTVTAQGKIYRKPGFHPGKNFLDYMIMAPAGSREDLNFAESQRSIWYPALMVTTNNGNHPADNIQPGESRIDFVYARRELPFKPEP